MNTQSNIITVEFAWKKPLPNIDEDNAAFYEGLRQHRFLLWRCTKCGAACGEWRAHEMFPVQRAFWCQLGTPLHAEKRSGHQLGLSECPCCAELAVEVSRTDRHGEPIGDWVAVNPTSPVAGARDQIARRRVH